VGHTVTKFLAELFIQDWAPKLITGPIFAAFVYFVLWIFAKDANPVVILPAKRKWFFLAFLIAGWFGIYIAQSAIRSLGPGGSRPSDFDCELLGNPAVGNDAGDGKVTTVTWALSILNRGDPSVVRKWRCTIDMGNGQSETALAPMFSLGLWTPNAEGKLVQLDRSQYLPYVASEQRIERNMQKTGWAYFKFAKVAFDDAMRPGTKITLQFEDASGKKKNYCGLHCANRLQKRHADSL